jgi:2-polyprenyl-6-methoxyphenol hydroxylase-like FAD-dependent oxidoreductase
MTAGLQIRTLEVLEQRGVAERFVSQGQAFRRAPFAHTTLDLSDLPTRHNYYIALWQAHCERIPADWVGQLAVPIYRACEVTGFAQDATGVDVELSDGRSLRAQFLVGCDGGRSLGEGTDQGLADALTTWFGPPGTPAMDR